MQEIGGESYVVACRSFAARYCALRMRESAEPGRRPVRSRASVAALAAAGLVVAITVPSATADAAGTPTSAHSGTTRSAVLPQTATLRAPAAVVRGQLFALTGVVSPAHAGTTVSLQAVSGSRWATIATARTSRTSTYRFTVQPTVGASVTYRVAVPGRPGWSPSYSPVRKVVLRNGSVATVRPGTVAAPRASVRSAVMSPAGVATLLMVPTAKVPAVGATLLVQPVRGLPSGLIARVLTRARTSTGWRVTARRGTWSDAWTSLTVSSTSKLATLVSSTPAAVRSQQATRSRPAATPLSCQVASGVTVSPHIDLSKVTETTVLDLGSRTALVRLAGPISASLSITTSRSLSCTLHFPAVKAIVGVAAWVIPIVLDIGPEISVEMSRDVNLTTSATAVIDYSVGMSHGRPYAAGSQSTSATAVFSAGPPTGSVTVGASVSLLLADAVGLSASIGSRWSIARYTDRVPSPCNVGTTMLHSDLSVVGPLASGVSWARSLISADVGTKPWAAGTSCTTSAPPAPASGATRTVALPTAPAYCPAVAAALQASANGRFLLGRDGCGVVLWRYDRAAQTYSRVDVSSAGVTANAQAADSPVMSSDGQQVAFSSYSTDLTANPGPGGLSRSYLHDMATGETVQIPFQEPPGATQGTTDNVVMSSTGRYVAFIYRGVDATSQPVWSIQVYDATNRQTRVAVAGTGGTQAGPSAISPDGKNLFVPNTFGWDVYHPDGGHDPLIRISQDLVTLTSSGQSAVFSPDTSRVTFVSYDSASGRQWVLGQDTATGAVSLRWDSNTPSWGLTDIVFTGASDDQSSLLIAGIDGSLNDHVRHLYLVGTGGTVTPASVDNTATLNSTELQRGVLTGDGTTVVWTGAGGQALLLRGPTYPGE